MNGDDDELQLDDQEVAEEAEESEERNEEDEEM
jgi:hypothetical protein